MNGRTLTHIFVGTVDLGRPNDPAAFGKALKMAKRSAIENPGTEFPIREVTFKKYARRSWEMNARPIDIVAEKAIASVRFNVELQPAF